MSHSSRRRVERTLVFITFFIVTCNALSAREAWALVGTFAQFTEGNSSEPNASIPAGSLFGYDDIATGNAEFGTYTGTAVGDPIPANFFFLNLPGLPADLQGLQNATMTMTASTTAPVVTGFGGTVGSQLINGTGQLQDVIHFTRNTPAAEGNGARTNLLTITFTARLSGTLGGHTASLTADALAGYTIGYSSDFLNFSPNPQANFNLGFTSWQLTGLTAITSPAPLSIDDTTQNFNLALVGGAGSFAGVTSVSIPEPSSCLLALVGLGLLGVFSRRDMRR